MVGADRSRLPDLNGWIIRGGAEENEMLISLPDGSIKEMAEDGVRIDEILRKLGINPEEVIVAKNGMIVPEEETVSFSDELKIVRFVHGG
jgi:sulfur carrier protein